MEGEGGGEGELREAGSGPGQHCAQGEGTDSGAESGQVLSVVLGGVLCGVLEAGAGHTAGWAVLL